MNAVTFAEAGLHETAIEMLNENTAAEQVTQDTEDLAVSRTSPPLSTTLDRMHEAVAFAEAGAGEHAQALLRDGENSPMGILVVSHNDDFSPRVCAHAIAFARRQGKGIIALNVMETPRGAFLRRETKNLFGQFCRRAEAKVEAFRQEAETKEVAFVHLTTQGNVERAIRTAHEKHPGVRFVVTDPASLGEESASAGTISVFALAHHNG